jgi:hypothetical protein
MILAIDPGTTESGWCVFDGERVRQCGVSKNSFMLRDITFAGMDKNIIRTTNAIIPADDLAIEMVASYGMPVGREVFETCVWIGRFQQAWRDPEAVRLIYRKDVKLHLCGSPRAKDANIRQALIDRLGSIGTKAQPGPLYGVKSHAWAAVAVAVTASDLSAFDGMPKI